MHRRAFLASAGAGLAALAGCTGAEPEAGRSTPASTPTTAPATRTATRTATPTATSRSRSDGVVAADVAGYGDGVSHFLDYSATSASVRVAPDSVPDGRSEPMKVIVATYAYPVERLVRHGESEPFPASVSSPRRVSVDLTATDGDPADVAHHVAVLVPATATIDTVTDADATKLGETDRWEGTAEGIARARHPSTLRDIDTESFVRTSLEGAYRLVFSGATFGRPWQTSYLVYKSAYVRRLQAPRGRGREEYVGLAQRQGIADAFGSILRDSAEANGFTDKRRQVDFLIDFVQNLPYVTDDVSKGYDDYAKFVTETLAEGRGDCEDTAILMAALLQSDAFGYDCVLLLLPGHMALGVYGTDLPGSYYTDDGRDYYYVETTGEGWGIGDIPEQYRDDRARIYQV